MEPNIIDFYNEMPSGVNVIEKMNEELAQVQKENNILKEDLCMNPEYGRPIVEYKNEDELEILALKLFKNLKVEICKSNGNIGEMTIKNIFYKLIPNYNTVEITYNAGMVNEHKRLMGSNWIHWKGCEILKYVNYSLKSMRKLNIEPEKIYENIFCIITGEINDTMIYITKYRCVCGKLVDYTMGSTAPTCCSCWNSDFGN